MGRKRKARRLVPAVLALGVCSCTSLQWHSQTSHASASSRPPEPEPALVISSPPEMADAATRPIIVAAQATIVSPPPDSSPETALREMYNQAAKQVAGMDNYVMRLRRREVVQGRQRPEEIILVKFRREPFSVYLKWLGKEAKDREVIYVKGRYDSLIHTKVAAGDVILMPAGKRFSLAPDSFLARNNSRHPITEAGFAHLVNQFGELLNSTPTQENRRGTLKYLGSVKRPEFDRPVEGAEQALPPGADPLVPTGGRRLWFFDQQIHLPILLITYDDNQKEVEYYCHDRILTPAGLDDNDFHPDKLWGPVQKK